MSTPRTFARLALSILLLLMLAVAFSTRTNTTLAEQQCPATATAATLAAEDSTPDPASTTFTTTDDADPDDASDGDLVFLYMGDGMAEPDRRDFPVQPEHAPDLPFTVTDTLAVTTNNANATDPLGYAWHVRNARVAADGDNIVFAFAGYAITRAPYLDIEVLGILPGEFKLDATMYTIESDDLDPGRLSVRDTKKGTAKVTIDNHDGPPLNNGDLGFVDLLASPSSIGVGETPTFHAQLLTPDRAHDNTSGVPITVVTPFASDPADSVNGRATFAAPGPYDAANFYTVAAQADGYTPDKPNVLAVVRVDALTPDRGRIEADTIQTGPNNTETEVWLVPVTGDDDTVTVTARPYPAVPDADLPASWSLRVGEFGEAYPHAGSHPADTASSVTVALSAGDSTMVIAECGTSEKRVLLHAFEEADRDSFVWRASPDALGEGLPVIERVDGSVSRTLLVAPGSQVDLLMLIRDIDTKDYIHPDVEDEYVSRSDSDWKQNWEITGPASFDMSDPDNPDAKILEVANVLGTVSVFVSSQFGAGDTITVTVTSTDLAEDGGNPAESTTIDTKLQPITWTIRYTDQLPTALRILRANEMPGNTSYWDFDRFQIAELIPDDFFLLYNGANWVETLDTGFLAIPDLGAVGPADYEGVAILEQFEPTVSNLVIAEHISAEGRVAFPNFDKSDWEELLFSNTGHSSFIIDNEDRFYDRISGFINADYMNGYLQLPPATPLTITKQQTFVYQDADGENALTENYIYTIIRRLRAKPSDPAFWQVQARKELVE